MKAHAASAVRIDDPSSLAWRTIEDLAALDAATARAWDDLAVTSGRPFCAPGWLIPWWRHVAEPGDELRLVVVSDGPDVVGIGPYYSSRRPGRRLRRWRPLGATACQRVEPLAAPGLESGVAVCLAAAITEDRPDVVTFEGVASTSPWPDLLRRAWPGQRTAWVGQMHHVGALTIDLEGTDFDAWFMARTSHFRQRLRRNRKELAKRGGTVRLATEETIDRDLEAFVRLHQQRWAEREPSAGVTPAVGRMLQDAGRELVGSSRLRVWSIDVEGETIASSVVLVAGGEVAYWLNAFDQRYASISPSRISILTVVEDAFGLGADRLDLGGGAFEYKQRFATGEDRLEWLWLVPPGRRQARTRVRLAPSIARRMVRERLSPETTARIKSVARLGRERRAKPRLEG